MDLTEIPPDYFENPAVRRRIHEFLGRKHSGSPTCRFFTADDPFQASTRPRPMSQLSACLGEGMSIARSLWDRDHFLVDLDIEYVNFDFAAEPYLNQARTFELQEPVVRVIRKLLNESQIRPLHLYSGRGHHFLWKISQDSPAFASLVEIGSKIVDREYPRRFEGEPVPEELTAAFAGLGLVMEHLAHKIKQVAAAVSEVPVELTAIEVGPGECGREMISIDISEYGDPLQTRSVRVPFTPYWKPWQQPDLMGGPALEGLKPIFVTPLPPIENFGGFELLHDPAQAAAAAHCVATVIPTLDDAMETMISQYLASPLRRFHEFFYSRQQTREEDWPRSYGDFPLETLPPCAQLVLNQPNDLLLKPWGIRLVTRSLLALGWHPRHISGLIRAKFKDDHGWEDRWNGYDPAMRADFYTRVFSGLFMVGRDDLVDFNCQSSKEERTCLIAECPKNLAWYRDSALSRRRYGYLADRPFNGLFLPNEHL